MSNRNKGKYPVKEIRSWGRKCVKLNIVVA